MKNKLLIISLLAFLGCKEEPFLPLLTNTFDNKPVFVLPSGKYSLKLNVPVKWRIVGQVGSENEGDSLLCTVPSAAGVYKLIAKNANVSSDSLNITLIVTPQAEVFKALRKGGYALVFRHAAANVGSDRYATTTLSTDAKKLLATRDSAWYKSCSDTLARQLNDQGKLDAQNIGKMLKFGQIPVARLFSSEFCRCFTTANLMNLGVATVQNRNLTYWINNEDNRLSNMMKLANTQPIDANNSILIGHAALTGKDPLVVILNSLDWGDAAVFKLKTGQSSDYVTTLKVKDFTDLVK